MSPDINADRKRRLKLWRIHLLALIVMLLPVAVVRAAPIIILYLAWLIVSSCILYYF